NEYQVRTVGRPHRADLGIKLAVIVARQRASGFTREPLYVAQRAICNVSNEYMKAATVCCRYESDALAIWRPARLCVDVTAARDRMRFAGPRIQYPQVVRVFVVRSVNDPTAIRGPVRLIVVAGSVSQLLRHRGTELLPPEQSSNGIDQRR